MNMNIVQKSFTLGNSQITFETGRIARQAHGAVFASMDDTQVLVSVVGAKEARAGQNFFPLSVDYIEKTYAAGKIPGGFLKREGRPSEKETLTSRLIDRPIRPLFPNGYMNEVQVMIQVISANKNVDPDMLAMIATSAALAISGAPFKGPIGAARVGYQDGNYIINPTYSDLKTSDLDMVVAGTKDAVLMVESQANELSEDIMLGAVMYAHEQFQVVIDSVAEFAKEVGVSPREWEAPAENESLFSDIQSKFGDQISEAYQTIDKMERYEKMGQIKDTAVEELGGDDDDSPSSEEIKNYIKKIEKSTVRERILNGEPRIDGRIVRLYVNLRLRLAYLKTLTVLHCLLEVKRRLL